RFSRDWSSDVCSSDLIRSHWEEDLVAFLLGCSFTFEQALLANGIPVRHMEENCNVPMYRTSIPCVPAGRFKGPMVVSMRPIPEKIGRASCRERVELLV